LAGGITLGSPNSGQQLSPLDADAQRYKSQFEDAGTVTQAYSLGKKTAEQVATEKGLNQVKLLATVQKKNKRLELNEMEMHGAMNRFKKERDMLRASTKAADEKSEALEKQNKVLTAKYASALGRLGDLEEMVALSEAKEEKRQLYIKLNGHEEETWAVYMRALK
jgi:hypothetical protein